MGTACEMSEPIRKTSEYRRPRNYGLQNAVAKWLRGTWGNRATQIAMNVFKLSEGRARGAHYATASLTTINEIIKQGGWPLLLEIGADVLGESLEEHLHRERQRRAQRDRDEARLAALMRGLPGPGDWLPSPGDPLPVRED